MNPRASILLFCSVFFLARAAFANEATIEVLSKTGSFEEVRDNLALEVTRRGMALTHSIQINDMLEKTAREVGAIRPVYVNAEALEFCSPGLGRKLMEANSSNIVYCPLMVSIYVVPEAPKVVNVAYRRIPKGGSTQAQKLFRDVDALVIGIIKDALNPPKTEPDEKESAVRKAPLAPLAAVRTAG